MCRIKFDRYFSGSWPYDPQDGVGVGLSGAPTDEHRFIDILQDVSCSPIATRRILDQLRAGETKRTTISSTLDFNTIGDQLAAVGVHLTIIPPAEAANQTYDIAALMVLKGKPDALKGLSDEELGKVQDILTQTRASMHRIEHDFGGYGC